LFDCGIEAVVGPDGAKMLFRLFKLAVLIGLVAWANGALDLAQSASAFVQTALAELGQATDH
jgi:hypothetical protein